MAQTCGFIEITVQLLVQTLISYLVYSPAYPFSLRFPNFCTNACVGGISLHKKYILRGKNVIIFIQ